MSTLQEVMNRPGWADDFAEYLKMMPDCDLVDSYANAARGDLFRTDGVSSAPYCTEINNRLLERRVYNDLATARREAIGAAIALLKKINVRTPPVADAIRALKATP